VAPVQRPGGARLAPRPHRRAEALAAAKAIGYAEHRSRALAALAPHLDPAQRAEALAAAKAIGHEEYRSRALAALARNASDSEGRELMPPLLDAVGAVTRPNALVQEHNAQAAD